MGDRSFHPCIINVYVCVQISARCALRFIRALIFRSFLPFATSALNCRPYSLSVIGWLVRVRARERERERIEKNTSDNSCCKDFYFFGFDLG